MKKNLLLILLLVHISTAFAQKGQWASYVKSSCYQGLSSSAINYGYNQYGKGYSWNWKVKNNYNRTITFNVSLQIGSDKQNWGTFTLGPGEEHQHVSMYYKDASSSWMMEISNVYFGKWADPDAEKCWLSCDNGIPNCQTRGTAKSTAATSTPNSNYQQNIAATSNTSGTQSSSAYWTYYNQATAAGKAGNYDAAISNWEAAINNAVNDAQRDNAKAWLAEVQKAKSNSTNTSAYTTPTQNQQTVYNRPANASNQSPNLLEIGAATANQIAGMLAAANEEKKRKQQVEEQELQLKAEQERVKTEKEQIEKEKQRADEQASKEVWRKYFAANAAVLKSAVTDPANTILQRQVEYVIYQCQQAGYTFKQITTNCIAMRNALTTRRCNIELLDKSGNPTEFRFLLNYDESAEYQFKRYIYISKETGTIDVDLTAIFPGFISGSKKRFIENYYDLFVPNPIPANYFAQTNYKGFSAEARYKPEKTQEAYLYNAKLCDCYISEAPIYWYEKLITEFNYAEGIKIVGDIYKSREYDYKKALEWYKSHFNNKASDDSLAYEIALLYKKLNDNANAQIWFKKVPELGNTNSYKLIAEIYRYQLNDYNEAKNWYIKLAEQGNSNFLFDIALLYQNGGQGLQQDWKEAESWYLKAAEKNYQLNNVYYQIGVLYEVGGPGIQKDWKEAASWYVKSAENNSDRAKDRLYYLYSTGGPNLKKNSSEAKKWRGGFLQMFH